jgi:hypothetical protein
MIEEIRTSRQTRTMCAAWQKHVGRGNQAKTPGQTKKKAAFQQKAAFCPYSSLALNAAGE